jgi:16S rRNA (guanine527-N7)-methyltransferase
MQVPMKADAMVIDSQRWRSAVIDGARELGLSVTDRQVRQMQAHAMDLLQWNRTTNLTAITDPRDMAVKHYLDALAPAPWIGKAARLLDAGTGGGFPGIPLKIIRPDLAVTLVDSVRKKVSFLKHAIRTLELADTVAVHGRLEQLGNHADFRGQFDVVVCRAFSSLADFAALTEIFLAPGGCLLALKGPRTDETLDLDGHDDGRPVRLGKRCFVVQVHRYRLPFSDSQRRLVRLTPISED